MVLRNLKVRYKPEYLRMRRGLVFYFWKDYLNEKLETGTRYLNAIMVMKIIDCLSSFLWRQCV